MRSAGRVAAAREVGEMILGHFPDPAGGWFDTADDHEALIARPKGLQDNALPSGGAMAATVLLRLAALTGEGRSRAAAESAVAAGAPLAGPHPPRFAPWLPPPPPPARPPPPAGGARGAGGRAAG